MQIPVFKKAVDSNLITADSSALKPLPRLAAVSINRSRLGSLLYRYSYSAFVASLLLVFYPFIVKQVLWGLALLLCWGGVWWAYRQTRDCFVVGALGFADNHWLLEQAGHTRHLVLAGEVLCWSWLIILPLRDTEGGKVCRLLLFCDALTKTDNARLRRWLRACLTPKA
ncbi:protein YgfX [Cellvibrio sp. OA-2007]|uniref:protein YgfX n=1 Tax=Cellvibrio sp. OA-2007 TaxID=529823 RepID=UPI00078577AE|nr:protein YgfX [Cellvibrio sp. OA-2007]